MMTEIAMAADLMLSSHPTYSSDSRGTGSGPQIPQLFSQESVCHLFIKQLERNRYMPNILPFEVQKFFLFICLYIVILTFVIKMTYIVNITADTAWLRTRSVTFARSLHRG
jgi:hypothetical protein